MKALVFACYALFQLLLAVAIWVSYYTNDNFYCTCQKLQHGFPLAKTSGVLLSINLAGLITVACKSWRRFIYVSLHLSYFLHHMFAGFIMLFAVIHSIAHFINFHTLRVSSTLTGVGFTGIVLIVVLVAICLVALPILQRTLYHKFIYSHTTLFIVFYLFYTMHQTFCFIKTDRGKCSILPSWFIPTIPFSVFIYESIHKYLTPTSNIVFASIHNNVATIQFDKQSSTRAPAAAHRHYAGKLVWLCCPLISNFEWHPFSITAYDNGLCTLHIKNRGNWTNKLLNALTSRTNTDSLLSIRVQGPFINAPSTSTASPSLYVVTGIGATTFAHVFQEIASTNFHIVVVVKSIHEVSWLLPLLQRFKNVHLHVTNSLASDRLSEPHPYNVLVRSGRPNFDTIVQQIFLNTNAYPLSVYHSGCTSSFIALQQACSHYHSSLVHLTRV